MIQSNVKEHGHTTERPRMKMLGKSGCSLYWKSYRHLNTIAQSITCCAAYILRIVVFLTKVSIDGIQVM